LDFSLSAPRKTGADAFLDPPAAGFTVLDATAPVAAAVPVVAVPADGEVFDGFGCLGPSLAFFFVEKRLKALEVSDKTQQQKKRRRNERKDRCVIALRQHPTQV
jgi:hypothetical protein